jgi:hypothetical protein
MCPILSNYWLECVIVLGQGQNDRRRKVKLRSSQESRDTDILGTGLIFRFP